MIQNPQSVISQPSLKANQQIGNLQKKSSNKIIENEQMKNQRLPKLAQILQKPIDIRNHTDNQFIHKYIESEVSPFFTHITELTNIEVAKSLLKSSHIHQINKNRMLVKSGDQVTRIIIFLQGKFGVAHLTDLKQSQSNKQQLQQISLQANIQQIIKESPILLRDAKRKWKSSRDDPKQLIQFKTVKANLFELTIDKYYKQENVFDIDAVTKGKRYSQNLVACTPGKILTFSFKIFLEILSQYIKVQKINKISVFRKFQYFSSFDNERLLKIVDQLSIVPKSKGKIIYSEGQDCQIIYILIKGQLKVTKTIDLFRENPNLLYLNRQKIKDSDVLPHADFSQIYNYKPRTKIVQLGIISDLCIFGQEEVICNLSARQTTVQIQSQQASFYQINLKWLEGIMNDRKNFLEEFKQLLMEKQTERKIMYRQAKLSQILLLENKKNMDYFYLEEQKPHSSTKFKINKMNNTIAALPVKIQRKTIQKVKYRPFYNTFNFTELKQSIPLNNRITSKIKNKSFQQLNLDQSKVIDLVHTVRIQSSDHFQNNPRKKLSRSKKDTGYRRTIDIFNPLFQLSYFERNRKQSLRIDKQSRTKPTSIKYTNRPYTSITRSMK